MSHFTVLVIGDDPEKQLAPYHEFECTGVNDEYVVDVDETEDARAQFDAATESMVKIPQGVSVDIGDATHVEHPVHGTLVCKYASCFQAPNPEHDPSQNVLVQKPKTVFKVPDGCELVEVPKSEVRPFAQFIEDYYGLGFLPFGEKPDTEEQHKFGYAQLDEAGEVCKVIRRTNPNYKWDWYQLGGRWTGFFKCKPGSTGIQGHRGLMSAPAAAGHVDAAKKGDIDFDAMRREAEEHAAAKFDAIRAIIDPHLPALSWEEVRAKYEGDAPELEGGIDAAREEYNGQPAAKALRDANHFFLNLSDYLGDRDVFVRKAGLEAGQTFAIVKDGAWYERGKMGWFGMASDEKSVEDWSVEFGKLIDGLHDDTLLSVYDCHI